MSLIATNPAAPVTTPTDKPSSPAPRANKPAKQKLTAPARLPAPNANNKTDGFDTPMPEPAVAGSFTSGFRIFDWNDAFEGSDGRLH